MQVCTHCTPGAARRQEEGEMEMAREGARDGDGKGAHPRAPGSKGETAGVCTHTHA